MSAVPDPESVPSQDQVTSDPEDPQPDPVEPEPVKDLGYRRWDCTGEDPEELARATDDARAAIEAGECIVLPTDTVYGIGADAFNAEAVQALLDAKVRGRDMPPPVLIGEPTLMRALATEIPDQARELVARHWPGPLTIILKRQPSLRMDLGETDGTVALRVPDHELARDILRATGPMAVSSANISGLPAALTCDDAVGQLGANVAVYLDGGRVGDDGQPSSTIVDFTQSDSGQILRRGALTRAVLAETLPAIEDLVEDEDDEPADDTEDDDSAAGETDPDEAAPDETDPDEASADEQPEPEPVSAAEIRAEIETLDEPTPTADEADPAAPADPGPWHEPTTDELRITAPDHARDQPGLFDEREPTGSTPEPPGPRS